MALAHAHHLAVTAEELVEQNNFADAAAHFEQASEHYVKAALTAHDHESLHALRMLALAHSQRSHEMRCRIHANLALEEQEQEQNQRTQTQILPLSQNFAPQSTIDQHQTQQPTTTTTTTTSSNTTHQTSHQEETQSPYGSHALHLACAHLRSTIEAINFSAEELVAADLHHFFQPTEDNTYQSNPTVGLCARGLAGAINDSVCGMVAPTTQSSNNASAAMRTLVGATGEHGQQMSALAAENALLRPRVSELQSAIANVQRRATEQVRLARKALAILTELHSTPRVDVSAAVAAELQTMRLQLETSHETKRMQAEQLRKYERRWAQLKASARRKQMLKEQI